MAVDNPSLCATAKKVDSVITEKDAHEIAHAAYEKLNKKYNFGKDVTDTVGNFKQIIIGVISRTVPVAYSSETQTVIMKTSLTNEELLKQNGLDPTEIFYVNEKQNILFSQRDGIYEDRYKEKLKAIMAIEAIDKFTVEDMKESIEKCYVVKSTEHLK